MLRRSKEVRLLHLDATDPTLVGLTAGASVVRQAQQTRHSLNILKRVQLMQGNDSEAGASQPLQVRAPWRTWDAPYGCWAPRALQAMVARHFFR